MLAVMKTGASYTNICDFAQRSNIPFLTVAGLVDRLFRAGLLEDMED